MLVSMVPMSSTVVVVMVVVSATARGCKIPVIVCRWWASDCGKACPPFTTTSSQQTETARNL